ncbi:hypothetical protein EV426DRAFT_620131 [Tirmania nivea]|nr:hypothetical protein EV426DRAFT_620131 [Tirmania nivea]
MDPTAAYSPVYSSPDEMPPIPSQMDRTAPDSSQEVPFSPEGEKLGHDDDDDSVLDRYWVEPTPGSLRYSLQLRAEYYTEIQRAEVGGASIDDAKKRMARSLLLQEIDAVQSRMDHPRRPIWKYIIGFLVTGALGQFHPHMKEVLSPLRSTNFGNYTTLINTTTVETTMARKAADVSRSAIFPWIAWTLLALFIARSEFRQWVTRTVSSSLETLRRAAVRGDPVPSSDLEKIEKRWLWSFLVWKGTH